MKHVFLCAVFLKGLHVWLGTANIKTKPGPRARKDKRRI